MVKIEKKNLISAPTTLCCSRLVFVRITRLCTYTGISFSSKLRRNPEPDLCTAEGLAACVYLRYYSCYYYNYLDVWCGPPAPHLVLLSPPPPCSGFGRVAYLLYYESAFIFGAYLRGLCWRGFAGAMQCVQTASYYYRGAIRDCDVLSANAPSLAIPAASRRLFFAPPHT